RLVRDLNHVYATYPALHALDFDSTGFQWLSWSDADNSILAYLRRSGDACLLVALNFTPVARHEYRIGVPHAGRYREILNSDSRFYGGSDLGNPVPLTAEAVPCMHQPWSVLITLPPLAGVILTAAD
ncbi:MAG: 1,4-alpha-glucan branching enzyme, partial [Gammaproteobacteria bacterium]|nr:1,4-alpha-glucan branching enzyme [Gammaproteobacteria bacterium]